MGKNSNVHKRNSFHEADLEREREEEAKRAARREKTLSKRLKDTLVPAAGGAAPMEVVSRPGARGGKKMKKIKAQPLRTKLPLAGGIKKRKKLKATPIHKRQMERAAKSKEMQF